MRPILSTLIRMHLSTQRENRSMSDLADLAHIHAVFFDLDGTLMDSESLTDCAIEHLLEMYQIDANIDPIAFHGISWQAVAERLQQLFPTLASIDLKTWLEAHCAELIQEQAPSLIPGARQAFLRASAQMPTAIITGSNAATVEAYLMRSQLKEACSFYISNEQYQRSKPDPECYLMAAQRLGLQPQTCLVFEDSTAGLRAAAAAGMPAIAITHAAAVPAPDLARHSIADYSALPDDFFMRIHAVSLEH